MIFKKKVGPPQFSMSEIVSRIRGFILDSQVVEADHIAVLLGCPQISDEVADKEEDESDIRMLRIQHLIPIMYMFSQTMADGVVSHQRAHVEEGDLDEEDLEGLDAIAWSATRKAFSSISFNTLLGAIAQLVDMGYLTVNKYPKWSSK
jgi:hypothetical protein